jgi:hypothetical protein
LVGHQISQIWLEAVTIFSLSDQSMAVGQTQTDLLSNLDIEAPTECVLEEI